jgi:hypothetical protein
MNSRFTGTGEGNEIDLQGFVQLSIDLLNNGGGGKVLLALHGLFWGLTELAVYTVIRADLVRDDIDAQRMSQSPRWNRTEDMLVCPFFCLHKLMGLEVIINLQVSHFPRSERLKIQDARFKTLESSE